METIFDCKFKPESPDLLATASFDGTIKVWDVNTMNAVSIYSVGVGCGLYCVYLQLLRERSHESINIVSKMCRKEILICGL